MGEGGFDNAGIKKGPRVEVVAPKHLFELSLDPGGLTVDVQNSETPRDPLFSHMLTTFTSTSGEYGKPLKGFTTRLGFNDRKLDKDSGYYIHASRERMREILGKAGFYRRAINPYSSAERFIKVGFNGTIEIDYGPKTKEEFEAQVDDFHQQAVENPLIDDYTREHAESDTAQLSEKDLKNRAVRFTVFPELDGSEGNFVEQTGKYAEVYGKILSAFYEFEGIKPPDSHIVLAPPLPQALTGMEE